MRVSNTRALAAAEQQCCAARRSHPNLSQFPASGTKTAGAVHPFPLLLGALKAANIQTGLRKGKNHAVFYRKPFICVCCDFFFFK